MPEEVKYKCPECGWIGTEDEMGADHESNGLDFDESWSNHICPKCDTWHEDLEEYTIVKQEK